MAMGFYNRYMEVNPGNVQVRMTVANDIAKTGDYVSAFRVLEPVVTEANAGNVEFQKYLFSIATAAGQKVQEREGRQGRGAAASTRAASRPTRPRSSTAAPSWTPARCSRRSPSTTPSGNRPRRCRSPAGHAKFDTVAAIWSQYATVLSDAGQHAEAARALTRVIELNPEYKDVYIRRALQYMEAGQRQQALLRPGEGRRSAANRENVAKVLFSMGGDALKANRFSEATELLSAWRPTTRRPASRATSPSSGATHSTSRARRSPRPTRRAAAPTASSALDFFKRAMPLVQRSLSTPARRRWHQARPAVHREPGGDHQGLGPRVVLRRVAASWYAAAGRGTAPDPTGSGAVPLRLCTATAARHGTTSPMR